MSLIHQLTNAIFSNGLSRSHSGDHVVGIIEILFMPLDVVGIRMHNKLKIHTGCGWPDKPGDHHEISRLVKLHNLCGYNAPHK